VGTYKLGTFLDALHAAVRNASSTVASRRNIAESRMPLRTIASEGRGCQVRPVQAHALSRGVSSMQVKKKRSRKGPFTFDKFSHTDVSIVNVLVQLLHKFFCVDANAKTLEALGQ